MIIWFTHEFLNVLQNEKISYHFYFRSMARLTRTSEEFLNPMPQQILQGYHHYHLLWIHPSYFYWKILIIKKLRKSEKKKLLFKLLLINYADGNPRKRALKLVECFTTSVLIDYDITDTRGRSGSARSGSARSGSARSGSFDGCRLRFRDHIGSHRRRRGWARIHINIVVIK